MAAQRSIFVMKHRSTEPDFGATGQFDITGVFPTHQTAHGEFAPTLGIDSIKTVVLVGAGLAHRYVLTQLKQQQRGDIDTVLVCPDPRFVHPGLLMSWVAGDLELAQCVLDWRPWLSAQGVRWVEATCTRIHPAQQRIELVPTASTAWGAEALSAGENQALSYDVLSLDDEATPYTAAHLERCWAGAGRYAMLPQPNMAFVDLWQRRLALLCEQPADMVQQVCVLGASRQAIEWALVVHQGLQKAGVTAQLSLLTDGEVFAGDLSPLLQKRLREALHKRHMSVQESRCVRIEADGVLLANGAYVPCDLAIIGDGLLGHNAVLSSPILHDAKGRVCVNATLQSLSHPEIFAVGRLSYLDDEQPMPSSSEHDPSRQTLGLNLMAFLSNQPLSSGQYRRNGPTTINCGDQLALVQWGFVCAESHLAWKMNQKQQQALLLTLTEKNAGHSNSLGS